MSAAPVTTLKTDAVGGVVLVEPPPLPRTPGITGQTNLIGVSNGRQGTATARIDGAHRLESPIGSLLVGECRLIALGDHRRLAARPRRAHLDPFRQDRDLLVRQLPIGRHLERIVSQRA